MKIVKDFIKNCYEVYNCLDITEKVIILTFLVGVSSCILVEIYRDYYNDIAATSNQEKLNEYVIENEVEGVKQTIIISGENLSIINK